MKEEKNKKPIAVVGGECPHCHVKGLGLKEIEHNHLKCDVCGYNFACGSSDGLTDRYWKMKIEREKNEKEQKTKWERINPKQLIP